MKNWEEEWWMSQPEPWMPLNFLFWEQLYLFSSSAIVVFRTGFEFDWDPIQTTRNVCCKFPWVAEHKTDTVLCITLHEWHLYPRARWIKPDREWPWLLPCTISTSTCSRARLWSHSLWVSWILGLCVDWFQDLTLRVDIYIWTCLNLTPGSKKRYNF